MMMNIYLISTLLFLSCFLYSCQYKKDKDYDKDYKNKTSKSVINLQVGELNRQYELFTPKLSDNESLPILFAFHGGGGRDYAYPQQEKFEELVDEKKIILVFPLSYQLKNNEGEWQLNTSSDSRHDIDFIDTLIDNLSSSYNVDSKRVYATGYSLGSMFTYELACHLNSKITAIASFAGTMPLNMNNCVMNQNVPIMHIHGFNDSIISYSNQWNWKNWDSVGTMLDIPSLINYWKNKYNCQSKNESNTSTYELISYTNCNSSSQVEHYKLNSVGHSWPTSINNLSTHNVSLQFSATSGTAADSTISSGTEIIGADAGGDAEDFISTDSSEQKEDIVMGTGGDLKEVYMSEALTKVTSSFCVLSSNRAL